jgi:UDP-N-acetylglucosamine--N-acetylmuramyl-(pentapeptide) pyrophosphoryl-undecaprenol N-acetylglucosamine transferase
VADLAISRSGASSCAELTACGVGSILFPYPFHKDAHQKLNAKALVEAGAAVQLDDQRDRVKNAQALRPVLEELLFDDERRRAMGASARAIGKPAAADAVAAHVAQIADAQ